MDININKREYVVEKIQMGAYCAWGATYSFDEFKTLLDEQSKDLIDPRISYEYPDNGYYDEDDPYVPVLHIVGYRKRNEIELKRYDKEQIRLTKQREKAAKEKELREAKQKEAELNQLEKLAKKHKKALIDVPAKNRTKRSESIKELN